MKAGLPSSKGSFITRPSCLGNAVEADGVFTGGSGGAETSGYGSVGGLFGPQGVVQLILDLSKSSEIYGASETVTPPSLSVLFYLKY